MTKKGYLPKLLAAFISAIMCLCVATVVLTGTGAITARADEDELPPMTLEEIDLLSTVGYKIEAVNDGKWTDPADNTEYTYDYKFTLAAGNYILLNSGSKLFKVNNAEDLIFNVTTSTGVDVTGDCAVSSTRWTLFTTDEYDSGFTAQKRRAPSIGLEIGNENVARTFYAQASIDTVCDGPDEDCTAEHTIKGVLRVLVEIVEIEDNEFLFTAAINDKNELKSGMWLTFAPAEVLGLGAADEEWTRAERGDFISANRAFFENVYFLENYDIDSADAAPTDEELAGKDLYTLMTVDTSADSWLFQTEVRYDHIEIYKGNRSYDNDVEGTKTNYEAGDAYFLKAGLKLMGKDGNGNWTVASEGGSQNVLARNQFYVFDGSNWLNDQYSMSLSLDKSSALIEVGADVTVNADVEAGKFAESADMSVTWATSNAEVATVTNGTVTGVAAGEATVSATLSDGTIATVKVTVVRADQINSITLDKRNVTLYTGETGNTYTLVATVEGGSAADKSVTWTSSNTEVVTVDENGVVTAVGEGSATVTATASDGEHAANCTVNVLEGQTDEEETPAPPADGNTDNKESGKKCGSNVAATSVMVGVALMFGAAVILVLRKKKADNK